MAQNYWENGSLHCIKRNGTAGQSQVSCRCDGTLLFADRADGMRVNGGTGLLFPECQAFGFQCFAQYGHGARADAMKGQYLFFCSLGQLREGMDAGVVEGPSCGGREQGEKADIRFFFLFANGTGRAIGALEVFMPFGTDT